MASTIGRTRSPRVPSSLSQSSDSDVERQAVRARACACVRACVRACACPLDLPLGTHGYVLE